MAAEKRKVVCWTKKTQILCSLAVALFLIFAIDEFFSFVKKGDKVCVLSFFFGSLKANSGRRNERHASKTLRSFLLSSTQNAHSNA